MIIIVFIIFIIFVIFISKKNKKKIKTYYDILGQGYSGGKGDPPKVINDIISCSDKD